MPRCQDIKMSNPDIRLLGYQVIRLSIFNWQQPYHSDLVKDFHHGIDGIDFIPFNGEVGACAGVMVVVLEEFSQQQEIKEQGIA